MTATERPLALAVITALEAELGEGTVGYGMKPTGAGWQTASPSSSSSFVGYAVIWSGGSVPSGGSVADRREDVDQSFQVMSVGKTAEQADAIRDRARTMLADGVAIEGARSVLFVEFRDSQMVRRDDSVTPVLYTASDRFTALTSPSWAPEPEPDPEP